MGFKLSGITKYLAVGFVFISALVMGYILYELQITKQYFADQLVEQSSARIQTELDEFFQPVEALMFTLKHQQESHFFNDLSQQKLNQFFIPSLINTLRFLLLG